MKVWSLDLEPVCQTMRFFNSNCFRLTVNLDLESDCHINRWFFGPTYFYIGGNCAALNIHGVRFGHANRSKPDHWTFLGSLRVAQGLNRLTWVRLSPHMAMQRKTTVTANLKSKQLLLFAFASQYAGARHICDVLISAKTNNSICLLYK